MTIDTENNVFSSCEATNGGAIISNSQTFNCKYDEFTTCKATKSGASIFHGEVAQSSGNYITLRVNTSYFHHCQSESDAVTALSNVTELTGLNITRNKSKGNAGIRIQSNQWGIKCQYLNNVENEGGYIMYMFNASQGIITFMNFVKNNAKDGILIDIIEKCDSGQQPVTFTSFSFVGNQPSDYKLLDSSVGLTIILSNCFFDFPKSEIVSKLNGHTENGGTFESTHTEKITIDLSPHTCVIPSKSFTPSDPFSNTQEFSDSEVFTKSAIFTQSEVFTKSSPFTKSNIFTKSEVFSQSKPFTCSEIFTKSDTFTKSSIFTDSKAFTPSQFFGLTPYFQPTKSFSQSNVFTESGSFSPSSQLFINKTISDTFTASGSFTPSNFFTPNRTKMPDGLNIGRADVHNGNDLFSKEELIKAAGPASISFALIIVAIVLTVFYIKKSLNQVRNENIPEFDSSLSDGISSSYSSFSYYTYSYSYYDDSNIENSYSEFTSSDFTSSTVNAGSEQDVETLYYRLSV